MQFATRKRGRPVAEYRPANGGDSIRGLMRLKDGRWRATGPEKFTFTEPNEERAIFRFREWQARKQKDIIDIPMAAARLGDVDGVRDAVRSLPTPQADLRAIQGQFHPPAVADTARRAPDTGNPIRVQVDGDVVQFLRDPSQAAGFWLWLRHMLLERREYVAKMTGVESVAWLPELKRPEPSPTLKEVRDVYEARTDLSIGEQRRCLAVWKNFSRSVKVDTLREITPEMVATWGTVVKKAGHSDRYVAHFYTKAKSVLNFYRTTGKCLNDVRHALDAFAVLRTPEAVSLDPHPISRTDFHKLLNAAEGEEKALLTLAMNLCFYPIDIARLTWDSLDMERGTYHAKRGKTKVARVGVLWKRTIKALKTLKRSKDDNYVFHRPYNGKPHSVDTLAQLMIRLRKKAKLPDTVKFADIRDGAYTAAVSGEGVEFVHARILAGHRAGMADNYVLRNPMMVAKACETVEKAYFGAPLKV